jgi:hypothetical protein
LTALKRQGISKISDPDPQTDADPGLDPKQKKINLFGHCKDIKNALFNLHGNNCQTNLKLLSCTVWYYHIPSEKYTLGLS